MAKKESRKDEVDFTFQIDRGIFIRPVDRIGIIDLQYWIKPGDIFQGMEIIKSGELRWLRIRVVRR